MAVTLGSERLLASGLLTGWRVGVVSNPASVDGAFRHVVDRIAAVPVSNTVPNEAVVIQSVRRR